MADEFNYDAHPILLDADSTDLSAGPLTHMKDAVTKGVPLAAASGMLSMYNSVRSIATFGRSEDVVLEDTLQRSSSALAGYYADNKEAVDVVGFVATSLIPGSLGVKGLRLAQTGAMGSKLASVTGLARGRTAYYMEKALQETAENGGAIAGVLSKTRKSQLLWETADQALTASAAELMIAGTMFDSPMLDGQGIKDYAYNIALGTVFGGVLGGAIAGFEAKGILKAAQKEIEFQKRLVDTVFDPALQGLSKGTETLLMAESIAKLPDEFLNTPFKYRFNGKVIEVEGGLPTADAFKKAKESAEMLGLGKLGVKFTELANNDANFGQAYFDMIRRGAAAVKAAGGDVEDTMGHLHGYLSNVRNIGAVDEARVALDAKKFYVTLNPTGPADLFTQTRSLTGTGKQAYYLADGVTQAHLNVVPIGATGAADLRSAFSGANAPDVVLLPSGRAAVNPRSKNVLKLKENPRTVRALVDLETATVDDTAVLHFADIVQSGKMTVGETVIEAGKRSFPQAGQVATDAGKSAIEGSARFAWASHLAPLALKRVTGGLIEETDLPVLSRLVELVKDNTLSPGMLNGFKVQTKAGVITMEDFLNFGTLESRVDAIKHQVLAEQLAKHGAQDLKHLSAHMNESTEWLEAAVARQFSPAPAGQGVASRLTADALRPKTVQVEWEFPATAALMTPEEAYKLQFGPSFHATVELTRQYQWQTADLVGKNALNAVLGADAAQLPQAGADLARLTTQAGAGASVLGASNAGYAQHALNFVQNMGAQVALITERRRTALVESMASNINAIRMNEQAAADLGVLTNALRKSEHRFYFDAGVQNRLISEPLRDLMASQKVSANTALRMLENQAGGVKPRVPHVLDIKTQEAADFLKLHRDINDARNAKDTVLKNAMGLSTREGFKGVVYAPPVNMAKFPHHAFVRTKDKIGVASETTMLTARSKEELEKLANSINKDNYDVIYDKNTELYFKAKGEYQYSRTLNEPRVNSDLERTGKLADFFPETKAENVLTDFIEWHGYMVERQVRDAVQVGNRQFFAETQFLSDNYRVAAESVSRGIGSRFKAKVADPFGDYAKTALNISKQQEFPQLDSLNEFVDRLGVKLGEGLEEAWGGLKDTNIVGPKPWERVDSLMNSYGLGTPFTESSDAMKAFMTANAAMPRNVIRETMQKANMLLASFTLRLDMANSLVNILSTPIMIATEVSSLRKLAAGDPELGRQVEQLFNVQVPGQQFAVPSTTKLIGNAVREFGEQQANGSTMLRYKKIGAIKDVVSTYKDALTSLSADALESPLAWANRVNGAVDKMSKFTLNQWSEDLTRFVSANVMDQITRPLVAAGKMTEREADGFINIFVNRTQGNYVTSQRPVLFQGTTGAAVSLFQTYAFNVLQQLHRHVEAGDKRTLAVFAGLQSTVFGFNGLPMFDAINTHLIGNGLSNNPQHQDAYSVLPAFNKEIGNWMMYGTASAFPFFSGDQMPALYSRGDINPRHLSIISPNPLDIPVVAAGIRLAATVYDMGKNMVQGADMSQAMLQGLEHHGINRPLAGFAQLLAGQSTTSKGALISSANDLQATSFFGRAAERFVDFGGVSRLMGARPMDEAVALTNVYRNKAYEAVDRERLASLGKIVKTHLYNGEVPSQADLEDFMEKYTQAGGRAENFNKALTRWTRDANTSTVNQMANKLNSPYANKLKAVMGGDDLPDYTNGASHIPDPSDPGLE